MASKRRLRRNACSGKQRFATAAQAAGAIASLKRATGSRDLLTPYRCAFCSGFHFGHPPRKVRQAINARRAAP